LHGLEKNQTPRELILPGHIGQRQKARKDRTFNPQKRTRSRKSFPCFTKGAILGGVISQSRRSWCGARIILSILCGASALFPLLSNAAAKHSTPVAVGRDTQFEALPLIRSQQNHLLVRAWINDKPALLIVDSGSPGTVIASKRRSHFGVTAVPTDSKYPTRVRVNGSYNTLVMAHTLRLGGLTVADVPAISADMTGARRAARVLHERQADGILGADVLFASRAVLDCQRQLLILNLQPDVPAAVPGLDFRGFQKVPIFVSDGFNLYVSGFVNGSQARLMIDTGAFATLLHKPFVRQLHIRTEQTHMASAAINLKEEGLDIAKIRKLSVGTCDMMGKEVGVVDLGGILHEALQLSPPAVGLLGAEILNRNHGIIDFGTRTLYLKKT
jgi:predicted aspartyl protease